MSIPASTKLKEDEENEEQDDGDAGPGLNTFEITITSKISRVPTEI